MVHSPSRGSAQKSPSVASQKKQGEGLQEHGGGGDAAYSTCFCLDRFEKTGLIWCAKFLALVLYHWLHIADHGVHKSALH